MKKMRFLAAIMSVAILAGCGGNIEKQGGGKSDEEIINATLPLEEKVTYTIVQKRGDSYTPFGELEEWNKYYEEKSNIHIEWLDWGTGDAFNQKLKLAIASGELPDAFYGGFLFSAQDYVSYGMNGILLPMEEMIDLHMPNFKRLSEIKPDLIKGMTAPDGHMYGIPSFNGILSGEAQTNDVILYNKAWLDKLGFSIPETTEEFYAYLKAVKNAGDLNGNGKADEIPFTFRFGTGGVIDHINGLSSFLGFSGATLPSNYFVVNDGKFEFAPTQPGIKDAMVFMNKLSNEGLIDKEAFTMDSNAYTAKIRNPEHIAGVLIGWSETNINSLAGEGAYVYGPPLKDSNGDRHWVRRYTPVNTTISFAITNKAKNPELLAKWADLHLDVDSTIYNSYGTYDKYVKKIEDGVYEEILTPDGKQYDATEKSTVTPLNFSLSIMLPEDIKFTQVPANTKSKLEANDVYCQYMPEEFFYEGFSTAEEGERNAIIANDVKTYVTKMLAQWIYSGGVESEWDTYLKELEKMGLSEWTANMQAIYERTK